MLDQIESLGGLVFGAVTSAGVLFNISQVISAKREAARAAGRAEMATREAAAHAQAALAAVQLQSSDIKKIEVATNSMKDALVLATAIASHAEGVEAGRAESAANAGRAALARQLREDQAKDK